MSRTTEDATDLKTAATPLQNTASEVDSGQLAQKLVEWFDESQFYVIALSGGVDSAVVAAAASRSNARCVAVTARSAAVSQHEIADVNQLVSAGVDIEHQFVDSRELDDPAYRKNDGTRCYYCKSELFETIQRRFPDAVVLTGTNLDDLGDYRPGLKAAAEAQVQSPLVDLGYGKQAVRVIAALWNLPVAAKPASPCLASRIAHGVEVTREHLAMIENAESVLRELGLREFRVRLHADRLARIEVPAESIQWLADEARRLQITRALREFGFRFVSLDLDGFRTGSLNPILPQFPTVKPVA